MNEIWMTIRGNAADKPQLWENGERPFARVNVASTSRRLIDGVWQDGQTEWFQVKAWGRLAQNMAASIRKGDAVVVNGTYMLDEYTNDSGAVFKTAVIKATSVGFDLRRVCAMAVDRRIETEGASAAEDEPAQEWGNVAEPGQGLRQGTGVELPEAV